MPLSWNISAPASELCRLASRWLQRLASSPWSPNDWLLVLGIAAAALLAAGGAVALVRRLRKRACHDPQRLFRDLCRAHRLGWRDVQLLRKLARFEQVDPPARLFVEPRRFQPSVAEQLACTPQDLTRLRQRLFGNLVS
jgi:hypothetical protein